MKGKHLEKIKIISDGKFPGDTKVILSNGEDLVKLSNIIKIERVLDVNGGPFAEAKITFINVEVDVIGDTIVHGTDKEAKVLGLPE